MKWELLALSIIKVFVSLYDGLTFPLYFIVQKPWNVWRKSSITRAKRLDPSDPYSAYVRVNSVRRNSFHDFETVDELFRKSVIDHSSKMCFGTREVLREEIEVQEDDKVFKKLYLGEYIWMTYEEADRRVENLAKGFLSLGVQPKSPVVILSETRVEWMLAAQALFRIGACVVTVYANLGEEGMIHGINETEVSVVVTSEDILPKIKKILKRIPKIQTVIYMNNDRSSNISETQVENSFYRPNVQTFTLSYVETRGKLLQKDESICPRGEDVAVIMYTSGSTGLPKGVLITHKNLVTLIGGLVSAIRRDLFKDAVYLAYLPLAHMMELSAECFLLANGVKIGYSSPSTLTDKSTAILKGCRGDASVLKPTIFATVPLILDRLRKSVIETAEEQGTFSKFFLNYAIDYKKTWMKKGYKTPILDRLVFKKIQNILGGRVQLIVCGGAPLSLDTHEFTKVCMSCTLVMGYGLTETSAGATVMDEDDVSIGRVGTPIPGCYIRLIDWLEGGYSVKDKPNPRGEIVIGGDCVTPGYFKKEELTKQCFKVQDGIRWFITGDVGEIYPDGTLKIIDRKKDIVKIACGEYISLNKVEAELKTCSLVDNVCIYANGLHNYIVALVVPNEKQLRQIASHLGVKNMIYTNLCSDKKVIDEATEIIRIHGLKCGLMKRELPVRIKLCMEEWTPDMGLVTSALKLRRHLIYKFYSSFINDMLNDGEESSDSQPLLQ